MAFEYKTAGESHGPELIAIAEGVPAGLPLTAADINNDLARRQLGYGRGGRMRIETDQALIVSGVRHGETLGSPIGLRIKNKDWQNWQGIMAAEQTEAEFAPLIVPRPGHADLAGMQKYAHSDIRNILERASARETAARVAVGALARRLLGECNVAIVSHVLQIGSAVAGPAQISALADFDQVDSSPVRCLDAEATEAMKAEIDSARSAGESVGGIFEVIAFGLAPGLGSHISGPERLGGRISGALMSIPAIKGVEIGDGFALAAKRGSDALDEIFFDGQRGYYRRTNHAGGLEGGMTTGQPLVVRACMKPIPTLTKPLLSVNTVSGEEAPAHKERSDVCAVPAAAVVAEAMLAIELARVLLKKFGGDCLIDIMESYRAYLRRVKASWPQP